MQIQCLKTFLVVITTLFAAAANSAWADSMCFNPSQRQTKRLALPSPLAEDSTDSLMTALGQKSDGLSWAAVQGDVDHSITAIYQALVSHEPTKDGNVSEQNINVVNDGIADLHQHIHSVVHAKIAGFIPVPVTVKWDEDWFFTVLKGTLAAPADLLVSYEQTAFNTYMHHWCGNIELQKTSDSATNVYLYDEVQAHGQDDKSELDGRIGTLQKLRQLK